MNDEEMRELFRAMREEPVPADALARVRMGVADGIAKTKAGGNWHAAWTVAAALIMASCIAAGFLLLRPARTPVPVTQPVTQEIAKSIPPPETPVRAVPRPKPVRRQTRRIQTVPVTIRIETPDPDVVILLLN